MSHADKTACDFLLNSADAAYAEQICQFQGCPTVAVTRKGRFFLGWYAGGVTEPDMDNYNLLVYSDDDGETWSDPVVIIPSNKARSIHALDIQLWISPEGKLFVFWVQNNTVQINEHNKEELKNYTLGGWAFNDFRHAQWLSVCDDPDAPTLSFSVPRCIDYGFLRCKPLVLKDGGWLLFNYDQMHDRYGYSISCDRGRTYQHFYGAPKIATPFDEAMAYERKDGSIRMLARSSTGKLGESISYDGAVTWSEAVQSEIDNPDTRFFAAVTPTGRVLMVNNDHPKERTNMTVYLSEDDGATWKYKRCIDTRSDVSYPDVDFYGGRIYLTYDRERTGAGEILFLSFTEDDIMDEQHPFTPRVVSKFSKAQE